MGCIHSDAPVDIIRLTFRAGVPTARLIQNAEVLELMRNPLLRSTVVLSGLFYEFVVVTESDADRAFYQEINERLLRFEPKSGIPNCLFLNAQNKQTVHTIIRPLRSLGIPTAGIVDIDVLKEGGEVWAKFLSSANVPEALRTSTGHLRQSIKAAMESTKLDMKKHGGIGILEKHDREAAQSLLYQLNEYGLFVVPGGELEFWLKNLKAAGHGPNWLIDIFGKMGNDPEAAEYVKPTEGDVWQFMGLVKAWLADPNRKGIPD